MAMKLCNCLYGKRPRGRRRTERCSWRKPPSCTPPFYSMGLTARPEAPGDGIADFVQQAARPRVPRHLHRPPPGPPRRRPRRSARLPESSTATLHSALKWNDRKSRLLDPVKLRKSSATAVFACRTARWYSKTRTPLSSSAA